MSGFRTFLRSLNAYLSRMMSVKEKLQTAATGLWMMSESDYPFDYLETTQTSHNPEIARQLAGREADAPVSPVSLDHLLRNMTDPASGSVSPDTAKKFVNLAQTLKSELRGLSVYRIGDVEVDVLILGKTGEGRIAGLKTRLIET